jgi:5-deoxy-glucuronate isomerase
MSSPSSLLVRPHAPDAHGCVMEVTPASASWRYVGFQVFKLQPREALSRLEAGRETCLVILKGTASIFAGGKDLGTVGHRSSVFEDTTPGAVYVPADVHYSAMAVTPVEIAVCTAPGKANARTPRIIGELEMPREVRGQGSNTRYVRNILPETRPADSLLVVEVITPGGHSSSYPPHKHDTAGPGETALEETYYHCVSPAQGFAFQRVYTDDRSIDETLCVHDGDLVLVPKGYHPVCAAHGYDLYYLNVMAGPVRKWVARNDPAHDWLVRKPRREALGR